MRKIIFHILKNLLLLASLRYAFDVLSKQIAADSKWNKEQRIVRNRLAQLTFENREDAILVIRQARATARKYGEVTLGDIVRLSGGDDKFTDDEIVWTNVRLAYVAPVKGGYQIILPKGA
jgi:hypothetical protein